MYVTRRHLSRRAILKGIGAAVALPYLDAMAPAFAKTSARQASAGAARLVCIENVHGAAGSSAYGQQKNLWAPSTIGREFDLAPTSLRSLEPFRDHLTIISNTDVANANATEAREIGGDHFRSTAVFLTQSYPKRTDGPDIEAGVSLDQLYAQRFGQTTPIPSMQMCIEGVDQSGGCEYGYSCSYVDSLSWAAPNKPLPMVRDPRVIFDELMGVFGSGVTPEERREHRDENRSLLDWVTRSTARLKRRLGPADRRRLDDYLESVRQIERRIQNVEAQNRSGEVREWPAAPAGVPDGFAEHVKLMFDLQLLAFRSDITRVFTLKLSRDGSNRAYPESGYNGSFHNTSHHGNREARILEFARINAYHVSMLPYFIEKLKQTPDGDATLLDNTLVMYGSPMGDPNLHNHKKVPFLLLGHAGGQIKGGTHIKAANGTPLANAMLSVLQVLGVEDVKTFGDSEGVLSLS
jgi:Protein of unknown function (DUF1552)